MNNMKQKILMTLALLLTAASGAWAKKTYYNVTFGGFIDDDLNTTVTVDHLPYTFTQIGKFVKFVLIRC